MPSEIDKALLSRHFSLHAPHYDAVTPVQAAMGRRLLAAVLAARPGKGVRRILELGCGTGRLTEALHSSFPRASILAVDLAAAMVERASRRLTGASRVICRVADADRLADELRAADRFDLVISNAMLQWLTAPGTALRHGRERLVPGGVLACSTFGAGTFAELRQAFAAAESSLGRAPAVHVHPVPTPDQWHALLRDVFDEGRVETETVVRTYPDTRTFLRTIKLTGATLANAQPTPVDRPLYEALQQQYAERFPAAGGGVRATYECVYLLGENAP